jgi:alanine transaminase
MPPLAPNNINPAWKDVQYAVRGPIAIKAEEYRERLRKGDKTLPFDRVVNSNIGNPQQKGLDQKPITFTRQVSGWCLPRCDRDVDRGRCGVAR